MSRHQAAPPTLAIILPFALAGALAFATGARAAEWVEPGHSITKHGHKLMTVTRAP